VQWSRLLVCLLALTCACAASLGQGKGRWLRVRTEHFTLYTDGPRAQAQAQAVRLERTLDGLLAHGWEVHGDLPIGMRVVTFEAPSDLHAYAGREFGGYYQHEALFEPLAVLPAQLDQGSLASLRHELTHHIAFTGMPHQPSWFAEGIATYFETARLTKNGELVLGSASTDHVAALRRLGRMPTASLFAETKTPPTPKFYASSWLLVSYLMAQHPTAFTVYQRALGKGLGHAQAWKAAFPALTTEKVDATLDDFLRAGAVPVFRISVQARAVSARVEPLSRADEHGLAALLATTCPACKGDRTSRVRQSVQLALAEDPMQLEATVIALRAMDRFDDAALRTARALAARHPRAWLAQLTLGSVELARDNASAALSAAARAIILAPRKAQAHMLGARASLALGRIADARELSRDAERLQPTSLAILAQRAQILMALSDCDELRGTLSTMATVAHGAPLGAKLDAAFKFAERCDASAETARAHTR